MRRVFASPSEDGGEDEGAFWSQYEVIREIGQGGMGVVYEAKDIGLDRTVAIKKMRDEIRSDADGTSPSSRAEWKHAIKAVEKQPPFALLNEPIELWPVPSEVFAP